MKFFFPSLIILLLSLYYTGCSHELNITSPNINQSAKIRDNSLFKKYYLNENDTIINVGEKSFVFDKKLDKKLLKEIIKSIETNSPDSTSPILPNASICSSYTSYYWEYSNKFEAIDCKTLGLWVSPDICTPFQAKNTYGFKKFLVTNTTSIDQAVNPGGYSYDNLMFAVGGKNDAITNIKASNSGGRHVGQYFIDEPFDHDNDHWTSSEVLNVANYIPNKQLFLSSYSYPTNYCSWVVIIQTWGSKYGEVLRNNVLIMCDNYNGDCAGWPGDWTAYAVNDYWNEFRGYYGPRNISNWCQLTANNGDGNTHLDCSYVHQTTTWWGDLFNNANIYGSPNEIWLYAVNTGNISELVRYCQTAWSYGWLGRYAKKVAVRWVCNNYSPRDPCLACIFGETDNWTIQSQWYTGEEQFFYPNCNAQ